MPIKIVSIEEDISTENASVENYWISKTNLSKPHFCSALRCIERKVTYCKVKRLDNGKFGIIPLCHIHSEKGCESEIYDYHLAPIFSQKIIQ